MGPRIYPSQQDTNLTAKGSLLLSEDVDIAVIDVYVNNVLAVKEYSTVEGLYVVGLNIGDVVRLEASSNFNIIAKRFNYTTDYENGDNGVKVTELGTTVGISAYTFTVTTLPNSYNFEYYLDTSPFFINLIYEYSGITNPDDLYTIATTSQRVTLDGRQFNIPSYTYSSDTGFTYNIGQVFITGGTSQSFDTRTILDPISGGNCVRWQFGSLGVYQNDVLLEPFTGTAPVSTPVCNASKTFELGVGPFNLVQNATYKVRRIDTSQNIAPTPTPTATPILPTPTPTPPYPQTGITAGATIYVNGTLASYPETGTTWFDIAPGLTYNGTLTNGPVWSGGTPGFFTFDGVNDWVNFGAASSGATSGSYTFGGWFKSTTSATEKVIYMRGNDASGAGWSLNISKNSSNVLTAGAVLTTTSTATMTTNSTTTLVDNTWYYVMATFTPRVGTILSALRIYVNGELQGSSFVAQTNLRTSGIGWTIARGNSNYSNCDVAEFQLYAGLLTNAQILGNFNGTKTKYGY
jgi:hypothetical protein